MARPAGTLHASDVHRSAQGGVVEQDPGAAAGVGLRASFLG